MQKNIKDRASADLYSLGINIGLSDPVVIEMAARAGYDFVRIDCEHTLFDEGTLRVMIRMARILDLPIQVRLSDLSRASALLDMGVNGLMLPHVGSRTEAEQAVIATKYAPLGQRGISSASRALNFGQYKMKDYAKWANEDIALIVQIEDKQGLDHIDEILSVPGIDMVATGKSDLSQALGLIGQSSHPDVLAAEDLVIRKTLEYGKIPTLLVRSKKRMDELSRQGVRCFTICRDERLLYSAMVNQLVAFRN